MQITIIITSNKMYGGFPVDLKPGVCYNQFNGIQGERDERDFLQIRYADEDMSSGGHS